MFCKLVFSHRARSVHRAALFWSRWSARGALRRCRTSARRHSGYLEPASDISTFLYGRAESHSVVTKTPRSASSASSRSNSAFSLSGSLSANLRGASEVHGYAPPNAIFKHDTGNRSREKAKAPEPQLRGPSGRRGTSALRPSWRRYWHRNCVCQSQRLGGGTSRIFVAASVRSIARSAFDIASALVVAWPAA
jgi:hypothetical protein